MKFNLFKIFSKIDLAFFCEAAFFFLSAILPPNFLYSFAKRVTLIFIVFHEAMVILIFTIFAFIGEAVYSSNEQVILIKIVL